MFFFFFFSIVYYLFINLKIIIYNEDFPKKKKSNLNLKEKRIVYFLQ